MQPRRRQLPALVGFNRKDLPPELTDIDISKVASKDILKGTMSSWFNLKLPSIHNQSACLDVISQTTDRETEAEIKECAASAMISYAMPYYMPELAPIIYLPNSRLVEYSTNIVAESTHIAHKHYDKILTGEIDNITMGDDSLFNGFYIHTPIHVWDKKGVLKRKIPPWNQRIKLLNCHVVGNVNCYVLRSNLPNNTHECRIIFRGTSNEFNGLHQYGEKLKNSPVFNYPKYDPLNNKYYDHGSDQVPLFYEWYASMIDQVKPHIYWALAALGAYEDACDRIVVTGHSMGGALTQVFCYLSKFDEPVLWKKMRFRTFATPMSANDKAVKTIEEWVIESGVKNKYIDIVNTDDFVNLQYMAGGKEGIEHAVQAGTHELIAVLLSYYPEVDVKDQETGLVGRLAHIAQTYPDMAMSAFLRGAIKVQPDHVTEDKVLGHRMGQRFAERHMWGTPELDEKYSRTLKLVKCSRNVDFSNEFFGKSHSKYADVDTNVFWAMLRSYEDALYERYHKVGLNTKLNKLRIIPMFNEGDLKIVLPRTKKYIAKQRSYVSPFSKIFKHITTHHAERRSNDGKSG